MSGQLQFLKEHTDSVDQVIVFVCGIVEYTETITGETRTLPHVGATLFLCDGRKFNGTRPIGRWCADAVGD